MEYADPETRSKYISEIAYSDRLVDMIKNSFGNYVVQTALRLAEQADKELLVNAIRKRLPQITDKKIR